MPVTIIPDTGANNIYVNADTGRALIVTTGPNVLVPDHNALEGKQGGAPNEYYHLTFEEYYNLAATIDTGNFASTSYVNEVSGSLQEQINEISVSGDFYPNNNPSGYITGIPNIVYTTGNQDVYGLKDFQTRPTVTDIPVLLSGEAVDLIHLYGKNDEAHTIYKGQPVYINSANGTNPLIRIASNTGERTSSKTIGLMAQDVLPNEFGFIVSEGMLEGFNTSSGQAGDPMWLGATGNILYGFSNKPYGNNHLVYLGNVLRSQSNNGKVYVKVQNGFEIDELHGVYAQLPQDKNTLFYNSGSGAWISRAIQTGDVGGLGNYSLTGHEHDSRYYTESEIDSKLANTGEWNEAYSWGDHELAGYVTGSVIRPSDTGAFYPAFNPSGFITGVDLSAYVTGDVVRPEETGIFYASGSIGIDDVNGLSGALSAKQDELINGETIKTINGQNMLGSGDIVISGDYLPLSGGTLFGPATFPLIGSGSIGSDNITIGSTGSLLLAGQRNDFHWSIEIPSLDRQPSWVMPTGDGTFALTSQDNGSIGLSDVSGLISALSGKQDTLQSAINIKTINTQSILGSGDLTISGGSEFSNPSSQIGLTTVNGTAITAMRSDAAPPLNQSISPTWTAAHTYSQSISAGSTATALDLVNPTAATSGNQRWSPALVWRGQGWKTNATAASQETAFRAFVAPTQGTANPTGIWTLQYNVNNAGWTNGLRVTSTGFAIAPKLLSGSGTQILLDENINVGLGSLLRFGSTFADATVATFDTFLGRQATANIRQGAADAAAPVAQTLSVQNVSTGTINTAGANRTYAGSQGTGTGIGGDHIFTVATAGSSSSTQNPLVEAFRIRQDRSCFISNVSSAPATPTGGGIIYVEGGSLKFKGSSGTVTTIAPA